MLDPERATAIVFNGEIYNFLELRRELERSGYSFRSNSDTEVILHAYACWGPQCIGRLHGMFAFALWDGLTRELLLVRDRLGKKPLYVYNRGGRFAFGSEIKAILASLAGKPDIAYEALDDYLTYLYIPYPRTIFAGIRQLPPASYMRVRFGAGIRTETETYWSPSWTGRPAATSVPEIRELLAESVRSRLLSDVPLGVLLSGGLDSSSITALMSQGTAQPVRTFSIGFENNGAFDEIPYARAVAHAFEAEHTVMQAEPTCSRYLAPVIRHFDQPFGNPTAVLTYILAELTKRHVTVALGGDGGDELFGGYPRYAGAHLSGAVRSLPGFIRSGLLPWLSGKIADGSGNQQWFRRGREFLEASGLPTIEMYLRWVGYFTRPDRKALYTQETAAAVGAHDSGDFLRGIYRESEGLDPINRLAYVDMKSFLCCNVLEYADRMSMAHALELRAPFTDHRLVELSLRIPYRLKLRHGRSKWIMREAMQPFLPAEVLRKRKLGFNPPLASWLNGELKHLPAQLLSKERMRKRGFFVPGEVERIRQEHAAQRRDYSQQLWALMVFDLWFEMYQEGRSLESLQDQVA